MRGMPSILLALAAIVVWSSLAFLNSRVNAIPPFLAVGVALCVGGLVGAFRAKEWRVPWKTFAVGVGGIFGYHALLFFAFRFAPAVEVNLINYLWPLLIVLLSPVFLRGFRLGLRHIIGALLGFAGAFLVVSGGSLRVDAANLSGYLLAAAAALVWACYSLLTKRLPPFPTGAVGGPVIPHHQFYFYFAVEPLRSSASTGNTLDTFTDPQFTAWAQANYPNTVGTKLLTTYLPTHLTNVSVVQTAANIFPTTCGGPATNGLPCSTPMIDQGGFSSTNFRNGTQYFVRLDKYWQNDRIYGSYYRTLLNYGSASPIRTARCAPSRSPNGCGGRRNTGSPSRTTAGHRTPRRGASRQRSIMESTQRRCPEKGCERRPEPGWTPCEQHSEEWLTRVFATVERKVSAEMYAEMTTPPDELEQRVLDGNR